MKPKTLVIGGLAVAALAAAFVWGFRDQPVPVDLAEVTRGPMQLTVDADGKTRIRDIYVIAAPLSGRVERSPVRVGDRVIAGRTVVASVRPVAPTLLDERSRSQAEAAVAEAEAALHVAETGVRQAEEELTHAASQFARIATLVERGVASLTQLEDATQLRNIREAALESARAGRDMAEGALARARAALIGPDPQGATNGSCCVDLVAPADGEVLWIADISARPVVAGEKLVSVGQPQDLEIVADLLSADAVRVAPGSRAIIERWGGAGALEAILRRVEPSARTKVSALGIEEQRVDVVLDLLTPPAGRAGLADGYAVFVRIVEWRSDDAMQVPLSALFRDGDDWFVFRAEGALAVKVAVTVGKRNGRVAEILDGLAVGDRVITHPAETVSDGVQIVDRATLE